MLNQIVGVAGFLYESITVFWVHINEAGIGFYGNGDALIVFGGTCPLIKICPEACPMINSDV